MLSMIEQIYAAAARAGLLKTVQWISGRHSRSLSVEWRETDESLLHDLVVGSDITMTAPSAVLDGVQQGDVIFLGQRKFKVRDVRLIRDGSETRVTLASI